MESDIGAVRPEQKRVPITARGTNHQSMVDQAVLEAAVFLDMSPKDLAVLSCGSPRVVQYTRFPTDLNHGLTPELWEMDIMVGVPIPDDPDEPKRKR